jgi:hypothetical protein
MPRNNIERYWQKAEKATEGVTAQVLVTDGNSSDLSQHTHGGGMGEDGLGEAPGGATNLLEVVRGDSPETKICEAPPPKGDRRTGFPDPGPTTGRLDGG